VRQVLRASAVLAITSLGLVGTLSPTAAQRLQSLPPTGAGVDVSFPQCSAHSHVELPASIPFAVVGVNGGTASTANPCFASEYNSAILLAGKTEQPHVAVYVNTGNPALAAVWWPTTDATQSGTRVVNPNGPCTHLAGSACAYVYGYSMAQADYRRARASRTRLPELWWLDVETSNTWQSDTNANAASLSGMVDYLRSKRRSVGIYSTSYQWNLIAGVTSASSSLAGLRSWLAGASQVGAPIDCERSPLTPRGWVAMVQYVTQFDNDVSCHRFDAVSPRIVVASSTATGTVLRSISGVWAPGSVSYARQWNRNGVAIPGATGVEYVTMPSDAGTKISVTITGMSNGYSTTARSSTAVLVEPSQPIQLEE
jgi:hypothetical protein